MRSLFLLLFLLLCELSFSQSIFTDITLKRSIWFYKQKTKGDMLNDRITINNGATISFKPDTSYYLNAKYKKSLGFVLRDHISNEYQSRLITLPKEIQVYGNYNKVELEGINYAGKQLRSAANIMIIGDALAIVGAAFGTIMATSTKNTTKIRNAGIAIGSVSVGLGFALNLVGKFKISEAGNVLLEYNQELK